jgi:protein gp37
MRCAAPRVHWVIVGGESGHGARPMHPDWARSLRDQCAAAGVPFLFKQWGEWMPIGQQGNGDGPGCSDFPGYAKAGALRAAVGWRGAKLGRPAPC